MAAAAPHAGDVSRLYLVYTPPELRGRGYASACVATLTAREQATTPGYRCMLYTDLANAATNRLYQAIGYRRVGTMASVRFETAPTPRDPLPHRG
jgi:predicted GNAT family acetyltransferase